VCNVGCTRAVRRVWPCLAILSLAVVTPSAFADQPKFEIAAIRRSRPETKWSYHLGPGSRAIMTGFRVRDLILLAWHTQDFRILGEPAWADSDRFDIEARAQATPTEDEFRLMVRSLLEERFHLVLRSESRQMPVFNLVPDGKPANLVRTKEGTCAPFDTSAGANDPQDPQAKPFCGFSEHLVQNGNGPVTQLRARGVTTALLARVLGTTLDRQVNDETQIPGTFDFVLEYAPDNQPTVDGPPSLFTAIREQLGLKLESARGPVDVFVVDNVQRPSEN
jgi:uncharacterized protein (TIGR03435 family)